MNCSINGLPIRDFSLNAETDIESLSVLDEIPANTDAALASERISMARERGAMREGLEN